MFRIERGIILKSKKNCFNFGIGSVGGSTH